MRATVGCATPNNHIVYTTFFRSAGGARPRDKG
jgi:hypothetical protein